MKKKTSIQWCQSKICYAELRSETAACTSTISGHRCPLNIVLKKKRKDPLPYLFVIIKGSSAPMWKHFGKIWFSCLEADMSLVCKHSDTAYGHGLMESLGRAHHAALHLSRKELARNTAHVPSPFINHGRCSCTVSAIFGVILSTFNKQICIILLPVLCFAFTSNMWRYEDSFWFTEGFFSLFFNDILDVERLCVHQL